MPKFEEVKDMGDFICSIDRTMGIVFFVSWLNHI